MTECTFYDENGDETESTLNPAKILFILGIEHVFILIKIILRAVIADQAPWVEEELAKIDFEEMKMQEAAIKEAADAARRKELEMDGEETFIKSALAHSDFHC
jgi:hypothetical protein